MSDNPREILKAAGVECAEVDKYLDYDARSWCHADPSVTVEPGLAAILALARLVAAEAKDSDRYRDCFDTAVEERDLARRDLAQAEAERDKYKWERNFLVSAISEEWGEGTQESFGLEPESICCGLDAKWESGHAS